MAITMIKTIKMMTIASDNENYDNYYNNDNETLRQSYKRPRKSKN
jgi:hypothetical protein